MTEKIPSPCISICQMDPIKNVCIGCYRTRKEIGSWPAMNGDEQRQLLTELKDRRAEQTGIVRRTTSRNRSQNRSGKASGLASG